jgi:hypothetical protein
LANLAGRLRHRAQSRGRTDRYAAVTQSERVSERERDGQSIDTDRQRRESCRERERQAGRRCGVTPQRVRDGSNG